MKEYVKRGLLTGAKLAAASTATLLITSTLKSRSPFAGLNALASVFRIGGERTSTHFDPKETPIGFANLVGGMLAWGIAYEGVLSATRRRNPLIAGALSGLSKFAVDRFLMPGRLTQNLHRAVGVGGTMAKYIVIGSVSAVAARASRRFLERRQEQGGYGQEYGEYGQEQRGQRQEQRGFAQEQREQRGAQEQKEQKGGQEQKGGRRE